MGNSCRASNDNQNMHNMVVMAPLESSSDIIREGIIIL